MSAQELEAEAEIERLRQEQAALLAERQELERTNERLMQQSSAQEAADGLDTEMLLKRIGDDIQDLHAENERLKQDVADLDHENALLRQAVNLPEGPEGDQVLRDTVTALEAPPSARHFTAVGLSDDPEGQREALRDAQQELLAERARLRTEAAQLCGDLQTNLQQRKPFDGEPLAGVLEEYGNLANQQGELQQENERLKAQMSECHDAQEEDDAETHGLRRQLTAAMLKHTFFPPKTKVAEVPAKVSMPERIDEFKEFKVSSALEQLLKVAR